MTVPNFLILGAARCGTTSLFRYLGQHPDVFLSTPKEPVFFEAEYERGLDYYRRTYFAGWDGQAVAGEARPSHLVLPFVAPRIRESLPDARLIAVLRDPVGRAHSHWWLRRCLGTEPLSFEDAIAGNLAAIETGRDLTGEAGARLWRENMMGWDGPGGAGGEAGAGGGGGAGEAGPPGNRLAVYLECGHHAANLRRYLELFPASQLRILLHDDLRADAPAVVREVWTFLGVGPDRGREDVTVYNSGISPAVARVIRLGRALGITDRLPYRLRGRLRRLLARLGRRPSMEPGTRRWLIDHYAPHDRRLAEMLGRDLSGWATAGSRRSAASRRARA